jgi:hypothetical protein
MPDLGCKLSLAALDLLATQLGGGAGGARAKVGKREAEFGEPVILRMRQFDRDETGCIQQPPERIAGAGEVMADRFGAQAGIDPDKQHPGLRREDVAQRHASITTLSLPHERMDLRTSRCWLSSICLNERGVMYGHRDP